MCAYFSKAEVETSEAMKQAAEEAFTENESYCQGLRNQTRMLRTRSSLLDNARTVATKNLSKGIFSE